MIWSVFWFSFAGRVVFRLLYFRLDVIGCPRRLIVIGIDRRRAGVAVFNNRGRRDCDPGSIIDRGA